LFGFSFKWTSFNLWSTIRTCCKWLIQFMICTLTSSTKTYKKWLLQSLKTFGIVQKKMLLAFFSSNGMTFHSYNHDLVIMVIFWLKI
jgi:hypothetical protein